MNDVLSRAVDKIGIYDRFDVWSALIAMVVSIPVALLVIALIDRAPPITYISAKALSSSARIGEPIVIRYEVFRYDLCRVMNVDRIVRSVAGDSVVSDVTRGEATKEGADDVLYRTIIVPETVAPGQAEYFTRTDYACNWFQVFWPVSVESPHVYFKAMPQIAGPPR